MDCNKEEAIRAKEIAERKMEIKDFSSAKNLVHKAQRLFSELDNISQMLTVCDVQCSAETKVNNEFDWYGILQVEQKADDSSIRKQYRKLARILHPDKNKFPGAEAAFKLICQANMVLSDQAKRTAYDMKRKAIFTTVLTCPSKFRSTTNFQFRSKNLQKSACSDGTFWTMCPKCSMKYQYYCSLLNKCIRCHKCLTDYTALEMEQAVPRPWETPVNIQINADSRCKFNVNYMNGRSKSKQNGAMTGKFNTKKDKSIKRERGENVVLESSNMHSGSNSKSRSENITIGDGSYSKEKSSSKKFKKDTGSLEIDSEAMEQESDVKSFSLPDPEFYDFEQERYPKKFKVDQIWAIYDDADALPRYYCLISEIVHEPFMLRYTWLEHNPINEIEEMWTREGLPVACGNYKLGESESCTDIEAFSHLMHSHNGKTRNSFEIYPYKSEVWALFKGWDLSWCSNEENHRNYEYEVVEIISDMSNGTYFEVMNLTRVQGFLSLFTRSMSGEKYRILPSEILRFSHRVPAYKMSGSGGLTFFEVDAASLPETYAETFPSVSMDASSINVHRLNAVNNKPCHQSSAAEMMHDVKTEFHDFEKDRSIDKLQCGQIWAVYSEIDEYPKFYAKIRKIEIENSMIHVSWVELYPKGKNESSWSNRELPATCGTFRVEQEIIPFESTDTFSHIVHASPVGKIVDLYDVYPRKSEVWAIYKDWSILWTRFDLEKCGYYVVEIVEVADAIVRVAVLEKVDNYGFVFRTTDRIMEILVNENLRFSHQIPAFRLTDEALGTLKGYWELDPASLPCR